LLTASEENEPIACSNQLKTNTLSENSEYIYTSHKWLIIKIFFFRLFYLDSNNDEILSDIDHNNSNEILFAIISNIFVYG